MIPTITVSKGPLWQGHKRHDLQSDIACMAPKLSAAKHEILRLIISGVLRDKEIADAVPYTTRSIEHARANLRRFGTTTAPRNPGGRPRLIDSTTAKALLEHLEEEDDLNLDEQARFL
jgi:transposase